MPGGRGVGVGGVVTLLVDITLLIINFANYASGSGGSTGAFVVNVSTRCPPFDCLSRGKRCTNFSIRIYGTIYRGLNLRFRIFTMS